MKNKQISFYPIKGSKTKAGRFPPGEPTTSRIPLNMPTFYYMFTHNLLIIYQRIKTVKLSYCYSLLYFCSFSCSDNPCSLPRAQAAPWFPWNWVILFLQLEHESLLCSMTFPLWRPGSQTTVLRKQAGYMLLAEVLPSNCCEALKTAKMH